MHIPASVINICIQRYIWAPGRYERRAVRGTAAAASTAATWLLAQHLQQVKLLLLAVICWSGKGDNVGASRVGERE